MEASQIASGHITNASLGPVLEENRLMRSYGISSSELMTSRRIRVILSMKEVSHRKEWKRR